jgi:hypothetical protein
MGYPFVSLLKSYENLGGKVYHRTLMEFWDFGWIMAIGVQGFKIVISELLYHQ